MQKGDDLSATGSSGCGFRKPAITCTRGLNMACFAKVISGAVHGFRKPGDCVDEGCNQDRSI